MASLLERKEIREALDDLIKPNLYGRQLLLVMLNYSSDNEVSENPNADAVLHEFLTTLGAIASEFDTHFAQLLIKLEDGYPA